MSGKRIIFYIFSAFILGTLVLVYVEYNSTKHVNALVTANDRLLDELNFTRKLSDVEKNMVVIQRKIRGFLDSGDSMFLSGVNEHFRDMKNAQDYLHSIVDNDEMGFLIQELDSLVREKSNLCRVVLETYGKYGQAAAADSIGVHQEAWVSFDMENTVRKITATRNYQLATLTAAVEKSGKKALQFSYILIALVLVAAALIFWYIIHIIQKLIRSERKERETARIKENFLANMSHEIRTPVNAILGFTELLSQKKLDEESKLYVKTLQRSGNNLLVIINDILDISKIEAGMMRIEKAPFSLRSLMHSIEIMMQPVAREKGIRFTTEIDPAIPDILEGDAARLSQILHNLLGNALKFTAEGFISVKIIAGEIHDTRILLHLDVRDTGIGIEPVKLQHIFGRFQQADETITRQYGGTGLGLSIVKDLVELQKGSIRAESELGKGTVFHVTLPYTISGQTIARPVAQETPASTPSVSPVRILVTEDNEFNQSLISHLFGNWQIRYDLAHNGAEAIEKLKINSYDLVLMDIQMPVMDGYTAAGMIRKELRSEVPIVAMTAYALPGEKEKCLRFGMNDYIAKPFNQEDLSRIISRYTSYRKNSFPAEAAEPEDEPYKYIRLNYMKEISAGNLKYEQEVTRKFLKLVPQAIDELHEALEAEDAGRLQRIAHNLKSTVSIMGLSEALQPILDQLEAGPYESLRYRQMVRMLTGICNKALEEAREFETTLTSTGFI